MRALIFESLLALTALASVKAGQKDMTYYKRWLDALGDRALEYDGSIYEVVSQKTGWRLPVYRIHKEITHKTPVILMHGAGTDATTWVDTTDWMLKLADAGYDVWFGNNSGTDDTYYVGNEEDPEEQWRITWADMGVSDVPAVLDQVLAVTRADKATYVGYSQGTAQMFYGISHLSEYYAERIERFVALAPCAYATGFRDAEASQEYHDTMFNEAEVYYSSGSDADEQKDQVCEAFGKRSFPCLTFNSFEGARQSLQSLLYFEQITISDQFQEPIAHEDWIDGQVYSDSIDMSVVNQIPVTFFVSGDDTTCPKEKNRRLHDEIQSETVWYEQPHKDHALYFFQRGDTFLSHIIAAIETGDPARAAEYQTSFYTPIENYFWDKVLFSEMTMTEWWLSDH